MDHCWPLDHPWQHARQEMVCVLHTGVCSAAAASQQLNSQSLATPADFIVPQGPAWCAVTYANPNEGLRTNDAASMQLETTRADLRAPAAVASTPHTNHHKSVTPADFQVLTGPAGMPAPCCGS